MSEIRRIQPNLNPATRYIVRVRAINPFNVPSDWSESLVFTTLSDTSTPNPPTDVATIYSSTALTVTWTPPTTNVDASPLIDLKGFELILTGIDEPLAPATKNVTYSVAGNSFTYTAQQQIADFGALHPHLDISIRTVDLSNNYSSPVLVSVTDPLPPDPTVAPILTAGYSGISVTMVPPEGLTDFKSFVLEHSDAEDGEFSVLAEVFTSDTYLHEGLEPHSENFYKFKVKDLFDQLSAGYSPTSGTANVKLGGAGESIFFHMPGYVAISPRVVAKKFFHEPVDSITVFVALGLAGTTDTIVEIYKNDVSIDTLTIPAGDGETAPFIQDIEETFDGETEYVSARVTTAGTGAKELGVEVVAA